MTTTLFTLCAGCDHLDRTADLGAERCAAFPNGIPAEIFLEGGDHRRPFRGDNGIQYREAAWAEGHAEDYDAARS